MRRFVLKRCSSQFKTVMNLIHLNSLHLLVD